MKLNWSFLFSEQICFFHFCSLKLKMLAEHSQWVWTCCICHTILFCIAALYSHTILSNCANIFEELPFQHNAVQYNSTQQKPHKWAHSWVSISLNNTGTPQVHKGRIYCRIAALVGIILQASMLCVSTMTYIHICSCSCMNTKTFTHCHDYKYCC